MLGQELGRPPGWLKAILFTAAIFGVAGGGVAIFFPEFIFRTSGVNDLDQTYFIQIVALMQLVMGLGYFIAFTDPYRHWSPIFLGLTLKVFTLAIYFIDATLYESLWSIYNYVMINNVLWVLPLAAALFGVYRHHKVTDDMLIDVFGDERFTLDMFITNTGDDLRTVSEESPVLLVFLRHFGCTFCREALYDIQEQREQIEANGTKIVLVHMLEDEEEASMELAKFGITDIPHIGDPECILYRKFELKKGSVGQLFGFKVWMRGFHNALVKGYGQGKEQGDAFQMPGTFLVFQGLVHKAFRHESAADKPNYVNLAACDSCEGLEMPRSF